MTKSRALELTEAAYARRHKLKTERHYLSTQEGHKVAQLLITPIANLMRSVDRPRYPQGNKWLGLIDPDLLALMGLAPILNRMAHDIQEGGYNPSRPMLFRKAIGDHLRDFLVELEDTTSSERAHAAHWIMRCMYRAGVLTGLKGYPKITPTWQHLIDQYRQGLIYAHPAFQPHLQEPPPWTGWRNHYEDRLAANFVSDWKIHTKESIEAAFEREQFRSQHVAAVNALQRVPLTLDRKMVELAQNFAVKIMTQKPGHGSKTKAGRNDRRILKYFDLPTALYCLTPPDPTSPFAALAPSPWFWLSYSTDFRSRLIPHQHLNYAREDHVRAMFRFANGKRLGSDGLYWLKVNCANLEGSTDKKPWGERVAWVEANRPIIEQIAANPDETFGLWKGADKPLQYVAACRELVAAWADPENFITHLPVGFDCTCSGIQHWAMICRDEKTARLVNLTADTDAPQDVYADVAKLMVGKLGKDKLGEWWRECFMELTPKEIRKLVKRPVMTLPYNAGENPRRQQIAEEYYELLAKGRFPKEILQKASGKKRKTRAKAYPKGAMTYLAEKVEEAVKDLLPGVIAGMEYVSKLATSLAEQKSFVEWRSPTSFPVSNRYQEPQVSTLNLPGEDGVHIRYRMADGVKPDTILPEVCIRSCAPNFIHSMDAAHLVATVNACVADDITDLLCVHDCFSCHAPNAVRLNKIVRVQLAMMYTAYNALGNLRPNDPSIEPPPFGKLDPMEVQNAEWLCI